MIRLNPTRHLIASLVVATLALLGACDTENSQSAAPPAGLPATPVKTITATPAALASHMEALGTLSARNAIVITSNVSEKLTGLFFEDGQYVEKDTLLATLEQSEEQAQLASARADYAEQQRELSRLENLLKSQVAAQTEYDQRLGNRDRALADIAEAKAKIAERNLRAPFSGNVGLRAVSVGALLAPGTVITSLDDLTTLQLDFQLPSLALANLHIADTIEAHSDALDTAYEGKISAVDHRIDPVSRSVTARALLENSDGRLKPGMLMRVSIFAPTKNAIEVPEEALLSNQNEHYLWLVGPQQQAQQRKVEIGTRRPGKVEIRSGLDAGEQVIVEGFMNLRPGSPVAVQEG